MKSLYIGLYTPSYWLPVSTLYLVLGTNDWVQVGLPWYQYWYQVLGRLTRTLLW